MHKKFCTLDIKENFPDSKTFQRWLHSKKVRELPNYENIKLLNLLSSTKKIFWLLWLARGTQYLMIKASEFEDELIMKNLGFHIKKIQKMYSISENNLVSKVNKQKLFITEIDECFLNGFSKKHEYHQPLLNLLREILLKNNFF